jgi:hypothetical protein
MMICKKQNSSIYYINLDFIDDRISHNKNTLNNTSCRSKTTIPDLNFIFLKKQNKFQDIIVICA